MYKVKITSTFYTKTEEQARYISQFLDDAAGLMTCETSQTALCEIEEVEEQNVPSPYNSNGDLVTKEGQVFRQVGWQINGGVNAGVIVPMNEWNDKVLKETIHGGLSPVYVEVGTD